MTKRGRPPTVDISGQRFGKLITQRHLGMQYYECLCDCGRTCRRRSFSLHHQVHPHCGCAPNPKTHRRTTTIALAFDPKDRALIRQRAKLNKVTDSVYLERIIRSVLNRFKEEKKIVQSDKSVSKLASIVAIMVIVLAFSFNVWGQAKAGTPAPAPAATPAPVPAGAIPATHPVPLNTAERDSIDLLQTKLDNLNLKYQQMQQQIAEQTKQMQDQYRDYSDKLRDAIASARKAHGVPDSVPFNQQKFEFDVPDQVAGKK